MKGKKDIDKEIGATISDTQLSTALRLKKRADLE